MHARLIGSSGLFSFTVGLNRDAVSATRVRSATLGDGVERLRRYGDLTRKGPRPKVPGRWVLGSRSTRRCESTGSPVNTGCNAHAIEREFAETGSKVLSVVYTAGATTDAWRADRSVYVPILELIRGTHKRVGRNDG